MKKPKGYLSTGGSLALLQAAEMVRDEAIRQDPNTPLAKESLANIAKSLQQIVEKQRRRKK